MLSDNINCPYPLLRRTRVDFQNTVFISNLDVLRENQGFRVVPNFSVNNKQIEALIDSGRFSYAVQIQCRSTYFRKIEYISNNTPFFIPGGQVHEQVELRPCIIVMEDLEDYCIDDFVQAFKISKVSVYKSDVVGIGNAIRFCAYYKADEVKKASSVILVQEDKTIERVRIEFNHPDIVVKLPEQQYDAYLKIGTSTSDQITLLTGVMYVPVIALALQEIRKNEDNDNADQAWYKSLSTLLYKMTGGAWEKKNELLEDPFGTAQKMLGDNLATSLKILDDREW